MRRGRLVPIGCLLAGLILSAAALKTSAAELMADLKTLKKS